ncbi:Arsenite-activated ATPase ArsA,related [Neospora caninum Liverpool]|uniref:Arsenite-activated ATPase ArsA,related n=1 Tax=Neospora caninum (strain Liverpool) TaxID=572307 RepID=F0VI08_NEOCL|nr:Arsenite-activated ATPase ArsA,related [Neospora caninum Liverpool]CBZ53369.1 Arsenite-activated ATPase ArsA,related [Neospora caninum Liverpool]|eukprot:XP_003883401.1 Arsenite-activated ATPase ArsA,related [Neospora caninum Liverpool]
MEELELERSLKELLWTPSLRWIFVGGKGGVGKTTTSCAVAAQLAKTRESVLIISTDPAHNISDAFTQKFSNSPSLVNGFNNLYAMEIDSSYQETFDFKLSNLPSGEGGTSFSLTSLLPEMLQAVPGIDEALSFAELMQSVQSMKYSVIVFDTAPTGHTLRLLAFPDLLERGLKKISTFKDKIQSALQMLNAVSGQQIQEQDFAAKIENLKAVTTSVREAFQDPAHTTFVCVCIPEFLSVYETERLVQELAKQKIDCSNIVVNQVLFPVGGVQDEDGRPPASLAYASDLGPPVPLEQLLAPPAPQGEAETVHDENARLRRFIHRIQIRTRSVGV